MYLKIEVIIVFVIFVVVGSSSSNSSCIMVKNSNMAWKAVRVILTDFESYSDTYYLCNLGQVN